MNLEKTKMEKPMMMVTEVRGQAFVSLIIKLFFKSKKQRPDIHTKGTVRE